MMGRPPKPTAENPAVVVHGDCREVLATLPDGKFDCVVTDPPYGLEFMGKEWDSIGGGRKSKPGIGDRQIEWVSNRGWNGHRCVSCGHLPHGGSPCRCESPDIRPVDDRWQRMQEWFRTHFEAVLRNLKPGGHMLAFGGTRTYHRLACAVEDAGFDVRDCLMFLYGTGFPKGQGNLKPAYEPILLARRPGPKVLPLGVDECRVPTTDKLGGGAEKETRPDQKGNEGWTRPWMDDPGARAAHAGRVRDNVAKAEALGRYPANVLHDGSDEVMEAFAAFGNRGGGDKRGQLDGRRPGGFANVGSPNGDGVPCATVYGDSGSAARFFYCAKASKAERGAGNAHPTVKPLALMRWLVKLVCPEGGLILDPFGGSGTTALAALAEGRRCLVIEKDEAYYEIARKRVAQALEART